GNAKRNTNKTNSSQSLNHLLNFTLPPRQTHQFSTLPRRRRAANYQSWNKERFVNAQYRFVMNPSGDYTVHFADPDIYFQWQDILQIIIPRPSLAAHSGQGDNTPHAEGITTCPICLSPPSAPRMTKCGHVYCFPCILHLLSTSDTHKWVRCPICFDSVNERQLKAVKWFDGVPLSDEEDDNASPEASSSSVTMDAGGLVATPHPGSILRMRLMQRPQITTLALPRSQTWPSDLLPPHQAPFHFLPDVYPFAKFMLATPHSLIADLSEELDDLATERRILASMNDELGVSFIDAADAKIRHQMEKAGALETPQLVERIEAARNVLGQISRRAEYDRRKKEEARVHSLAQSAPLSDAPEAFLATQDSALNLPLTPTQPATPTPPQPQQQQPRTPTPSRNPRQRRNLNPPPPSTSTYYFYQAASGMPIFLHPLDIKILLSHFTSYASFPDSITVRVESYTETTVNEDLRKRCKYLAHLPLGADVVFVETDLEGVVGPEGLKNFERALATRRSRREVKGRRDDRAKARAEEREKERLVGEWNELNRTRVDAYIPPPPRYPSVDVEPQTGVWGTRSFASAAGRPSSQVPQRPNPAPTLRRTPAQIEDEYDLDVAFHELERGSRGGGKKRNNRLVVLGGAGGRRR
ncbi:hypothetical protein K474DRAFT_1581739, partial [Panus rudis PR-1116 ss-1]